MSAVHTARPATGLRPFLLLGLVALTLKTIVLWQLHDHILLQPTGVLDDAVYVRLGRQVAAGDWALGPDVYYLSPLYIYFLGVVLTLSGGSLLAVRSVQVLLGAASVLFVFATARAWYGPRHAAMAAGLALLTGLFTFYEVLLLQTALDPFLTALALFALTRTLVTGSGAWAGAAGIAFGLLAMNRPNALAFVPVAALALVLVHRTRRAFRQAAAIVVMTALTLAPVALRNRIVAGDWVLISSHGGLNFYIGNSAEADGTYTVVQGITPSIQGQLLDSRRVAERALGRPLNASEVSDYFYQRAWDWITAHPGEAVRLFLRKLVYVFNAADFALNYSYTYYSRDEPTLLRVLVAGPLVLVPLGLVGLVAAWPRDRAREFAVWAAFIPTYALSVAAFFVSTRYRLPLLVPLCVTAGGGIGWLLSAARARRPRALAAAGVALLALGLLAGWPVGPDTGRANERTELVAHLIARGRTDEADRLIARTEAGHPRPAFLYFRAGRGYLERGEAARAIDFLQKAYRLEPDQPDVRFVLGEALLGVGQFAEAIPHLDAARAIESTEEAARQALARAYGELGLERVRLGRAHDALAPLSRAAELDPANPGARYNLAVALAAEGRLAEARGQAEAALRLNPDYTLAKEMLGKIRDKDER